MDWAIYLSQIFELVIIPLLCIGTGYVIKLISAKIKSIKEKSDNETLNKYLSMLDTTITNCVLATTQTYVETLKKQGKFDLEAQKIAFQKTYDNVMAILTEEAKEYLQHALGDLQSYLTNKIEAEVVMSK